MNTAVAAENNETANPEYMVNGMKFIVSPVYKDGGNETIGTALIRLIKAEVEKT